jgi:hypothetical protein
MKYITFTISVNQGWFREFDGNGILFYAETLPQFHQEMICCQVEGHISQKNGMQIYSVAVQSHICVSLIRHSVFFCSLLASFMQ